MQTILDNVIESLQDAKTKLNAMRHNYYTDEAIEKLEAAIEELEAIEQ